MENNEMGAACSVYGERRSGIGIIVKNYIFSVITILDQI
jgi:hypothetical protein